MLIVLESYFLSSKIYRTFNRLDDEDELTHIYFTFKASRFGPVLLV
jgi:hypothetical protein